MITNFIIIIVLITIKAFLLAFIVCEKFKTILNSKENSEEREERSKLKKEHILLTESEDEEERKQQNSNEGRKVLNKLNHKKKIVGSGAFKREKSFQPVNELSGLISNSIGFSSRAKFLSQSKVDLNIRKKKNNLIFASSAKSAQNPTEYINRSSIFQKSPIDKENSLYSSKKIRRSSSKSQLSSNKRKYISKRGSRIAESFKKFKCCLDLEVREDDLNLKLQKKIFKLEQDIVKKRNISQGLPVINERITSALVAC